MSNEAAERLRNALHDEGIRPQHYIRPMLDEALAAERRAGRLQALGECMCEKCEPEWTAAILDEGAAR